MDVNAVKNALGMLPIASAKQLFALIMSLVRKVVELSPTDEANEYMEKANNLAASIEPDGDIPGSLISNAEIDSRSDAQTLAQSRESMAEGLGYALTALKAVGFVACLMIALAIGGCVSASEHALANDSRANEIALKLHAQRIAFETEYVEKAEQAEFQTSVVQARLDADSGAQATEIIALLEKSGQENISDTQKGMSAIVGFATNWERIQALRRVVRTFIVAKKPWWTGVRDAFKKKPAPKVEKPKPEPVE